MGTTLSSSKPTDNYYYDREFNRDLPQHQTHYIKWERIKNLQKNAKYYVNDLCVCDLVQGDIGNCYFVSAIHSLILYYTKTNRKMLYKFLKQIKPWQSFDSPYYTGKFSVMLWDQFGYQEVVVDDYIPVSGRKPCYTSNRHGEFWVSILEKAVVKFTNSSYRKCDLGGGTADIIRLFIPCGVTSLITEKRINDTRFETLLALENKMCTAALFKKESGTRQENRRREPVDENTNIAFGHAYCIHTYRNGESLVINPWHQVELTPRSIGNVITKRSVSRCRACKDVDHVNDGQWIMGTSELGNYFDTFFFYWGFDNYVSSLVEDNTLVHSKQGSAIFNETFEPNSTLVFTIIVLDDDDNDVNNIKNKLDVIIKQTNNGVVLYSDSLMIYKSNVYVLYITIKLEVDAQIILSLNNKNFQVFSVKI